MSLTPAQEMLNVKFNCDGFMTESESEEEEGVPELSKNTGPGSCSPSPPYCCEDFRKLN